MGCEEKFPALGYLEEARHLKHSLPVDDNVLARADDERRGRALHPERHAVGVRLLVWEVGGERLEVDANLGIGGKMLHVCLELLLGHLLVEEDAPRVIRVANCRLHSKAPGEQPRDPRGTQEEAARHGTVARGRHR